MRCRKKMPLAKNGNERGLCTKTKGHRHKCTNSTCYICGGSVKRDRGDWCRDCRTKYQREVLGIRPRIPQIPHALFTFPCGCSGVLPSKGQNSQFVCARPDGRWDCRVARTLRHASYAAKKLGYKPIDIGSMGHEYIRRMAEERNCVLCHEPLEWLFGYGKTPHLHHDHQTGRPIGFSHPRCNPLDLQRRVVQLEAEVQLLRAA